LPSIALELDRPPHYSDLTPGSAQKIEFEGYNSLCLMLFLSKRINSLHLYSKIIIFRVRRPLQNVRMDITAQEIELGSV